VRCRLSSHRRERPPALVVGRKAPSLLWGRGTGQGDVKVLFSRDSPVGARVVERRGEGLYGRPPPCIYLPIVSLTKRNMADAGDHKGPLHPSRPPSPLRKRSTSDFYIALGTGVPRLPFLYVCASICLYGPPSTKADLSRKSNGFLREPSRLSDGSHAWCGREANASSASSTCGLCARQGDRHDL